MTLDSVIEMGYQRYIDYQNALEAAMQDEPRLVHIEGREDLPCLTLTAENKMIKSEVRTKQLGHKLAEISKNKGMLPVAIIAHSMKGNFLNLVALSFRSTDGYDVGEICRRNGGGGYKQAAQCRINRVHFETVWVQNFSVV